MFLTTACTTEIFQYLDWTKHSWNAKLLSSTLLLAIYGILLLMIGIRTRTVVNRVMGLVLFALVIFKLYLSDVWMFDVIFKMIAFLALGWGGGLLVAGSYLYSALTAAGLRRCGRSRSCCRLRIAGSCWWWPRPLPTRIFRRPPGSSTAS